MFLSYAQLFLLNTSILADVGSVVVEFFNASQPIYIDYKLSDDSAFTSMCGRLIDTFPFTEMIDACALTGSLDNNLLYVFLSI